MKDFWYSLITFTSLWFGKRKMKKTVCSSDDPSTSSSKGVSPVKTVHATRIKKAITSEPRDGQHPEKCVIYKCNHCPFWTMHPHLTEIHGKKHTDDLECQSLMDIDVEASLSSEGKSIQPVSEMNPDLSRPKMVESSNLKDNLEALVFYKCEFCPYFAMQSDQMAEHLGNPPSDCEKSRSEKQMKQQLESAKLLDREKRHREAIKQRSDYQTTRMKTIQKEASALRKRAKTVKSGLIDKDMKENKEEETAATVDSEKSKKVQQHLPKYQTGPTSKLKKNAEKSRPFSAKALSPIPTLDDLEIQTGSRTEPYLQQKKKGNPTKKNKIAPFVTEEKEMLDFERFGLRECSVVLVDIYASNKKVSFASAQGSDPEDEEEMMPSALLMITELPIEEEDTSCFYVEDVMSGINDLRERISELVQKKETLQVDLDSLRFDFIEVTLGDPETHEVDQSKLDLIEENISYLKEKLHALEEELVSYREIEQSLTSDLKQAGF